MKNVVVIGPPRSGTSMLAGIFGQKGYFAAEDPSAELRAGDQANPGGYWESERLVEQNVALFQEVGFQHHNTWHFEAIADEQAELIGRLPVQQAHRDFLETFKARSPWIWKDPRLCFTFGYWSRLLESETTCAILISRDVDAVFRSFVRLGWCENTVEGRDAVAARITDHIEWAKKSVAHANVPALEVAYEEFAACPTRVAAQLAEHTGLPLSPEDLSFDARLNHANGAGRLNALAERAIDALPPSARQSLKAIVPLSVQRALFPGWVKE